MGVWIYSNGARVSCNFDRDSECLVLFDEFHYAVKFLGLGGISGIGNREILYVFMECVWRRHVDLTLTNRIAGKTAV